MKIYAVFTYGRCCDAVFDKAFLSKEKADAVVKAEADNCRESERQRMIEVGTPERFDPNYNYGYSWVEEIEVEE